ncbi:hypothetical protein T439DRAFT_325747 [Meredithblackwellia eburnea MCA 4105]
MRCRPKRALSLPLRGSNKASHPPFQCPPPSPQPIAAKCGSAQPPVQLDWLPLARHRELGRTLYDPSLPSISSPTDPSQPQRFSTFPRTQLEQECKVYRAVCHSAYTFLSGPLRKNRTVNHESKVVIVVAHTIRLLLILGHVTAANELDRAFFTDRPAPPPTTNRETTGRASSSKVTLEDLQSIEEAEEADNATTAGNSDANLPRFSFGKGLNISRGSIQLAWIYSLALRLGSGDYYSSEEVTVFLRSLHASHAESGGITPVMAAFLVRKVKVLVEKLRASNLGEDVKGKRNETVDGFWEVDEFLLGISKNERLGNSEEVKIALMESELAWFEGWERRRMERGEKEGLGSNFTRYVEEPLRELVEKMDRDHLDEAEATPASTKERARTLQLTSRFVLLRANLSLRYQHNQDSKILSESVTSVVGLHDLMLDLLSSTLPPSSFVAIRKSQTAVLYRILWSSLGVLDFTKSTESASAKTSMPEAMNTKVDLDAVDIALVALEATIKKLTEERSAWAGIGGHRKEADFLANVSSRYFNRLLLSLSLPFAPGRRGKLPQPSWRLLKRAIQLFVSCRSHDRSQSEVTVHHTAQFLKQKSTVRHIVQALVLAKDGPASLEQFVAEDGDEEEELQARLAFFVQGLDQLVEFGEPINRKLVGNMIKEVLIEQWPGVGFHEWRLEVFKPVVKRWGEILYPPPLQQQSQTQSSDDSTPPLLHEVPLPPSASDSIEPEPPPEWVDPSPNHSQSPSIASSPSDVIEPSPPSPPPAPTPSPSSHVPSAPRRQMAPAEVTTTFLTLNLDPLPSPPPNPSALPLAPPPSAAPDYQQQLFANTSSSDGYHSRRRDS